MKLEVEFEGSYDNLEKFLSTDIGNVEQKFISEIAEQGLNNLRINTPVRTGLTAASWYYEIEKDNDALSIVYCNSNIQNGIPIARIIQTGHGTKSGVYVPGIDYIQPSLIPLVKRVSNEVDKSLNSSTKH